jgi:hypothetical protein
MERIVFCGFKAFLRDKKVWTAGAVEFWAYAHEERGESAARERSSGDRRMTQRNLWNHYNKRKTGTTG